MKKIYTKILLLLVLMVSTATFTNGQNASGVPYAFSYYAGGVLPTISGSSGSSTITVSSAAGLVLGMSVTGTGIAANTFITGISGTTITLSVNTTAAVSGTGTFGVSPFYATGAVNFAVSAANQDNSMYDIPALNLSGFSFPFAGINYTRVSVSTNGFLVLYNGASPAASYPLGVPTNSLASNSNYPVIAPIWDDLSAAVISHNFIGNNLYVRWTVKWDKGNAAAFTSLCWVKLDCSNGKISISYSSAAYTVNNTSGGASMGIAGICAGDFYSVTPLTTTTLSYDSLAENSAISIKPVNICYEFMPINWFDDCATAKNLGTINTTCTNFLWSNIHALAGTAMTCAGTEVKDVWYRFIKPLGVTAVKITTSPASCGSAAGTTIEAFASCGGASLGCTSTGSTYPLFGELTINRPCAAETLYVKVTNDGDALGKFNICAIDAGVGSGTTCATSTVICSLPYNLTGGTTAGSGNDYDSTTAACHTVAMNGEDYVFSYTPTVSGCISVTLTSSGSNPAVFVYNACPDLGTTNCLNSAEAATGTININSVPVIAGTTYYIVVDNNSIGGNIPFNITVASAGTAPAYDACSTAQSLGSIPNGTNCTFQTFTTGCSTPSIAGAAPNVPNPSCVYSGPANATNPLPPFIPNVTGDVWFTFTAAFTGTLQINTQQSTVNTTSDAAMAVYTGTCTTLSQYACDNNSGASGMPSLTIPVINGTTYYIRVWSENPASAGNFDICFSSSCSPANDLPCSGTVVPLGGIVTGTNVCAGSSGEPANSAQCVAGGTINTVWYKIVVPASGSVRVRTQPLTLTDTQIQGFTFSSGCSNAASTFTNRGCNDDGPACSGGFNDFSEQLFSGMTPGDTLYVAVDGFGSLTGSFNITAIDGSSTTFPGVPGQDCSNATQVCNNSSITAADPGYRNYGNICDLPGAYSCWGVGERNSIWYQFTVDPALSAGTAVIQFDVLTASSTDIDLIMWDITGLSNACATLSSIPTAACSYAAASSSTGLTTTSPLPYAYTTAITFTGAPRTYLLLLNNWNSAANAGFTLNWQSTPISSAGGTAVWTGNVDATWGTPAQPMNWGACGVSPTCSNDAVCNPTGNGRQPTITGVQSVRNVTINAGSTLTITPGSTLNVCGNFTNTGTLICGVGSTVQFIGNSNATISGNLTGANSFAHLVINKSAITTSVTGAAAATTITVGSAAGLAIGQTVTGTGVYPGATITGIAGLTITLSNPNMTTVSGTGNFAGSVTLLNNVDVTQNFTVSTATSVFNINGKYLKVAGNFINNSGNLTFTGYPSSTIEFNGSANQYYTNTNNSLTVFNVRLNKTGGTKLYLVTANSSLILDSLNAVLNLTAGNIVTPRTVGAQEVNVKSNAVGAIINHNAGSFVDGKLRRKIYANAPLSLPLALDFPVGDSVAPGGYNMAVLTYVSGTVIPDVLVWFNPWPSFAPPNGPVSYECVIADYSSQPLLDNGYWNFSKASVSFNGQYTLSLRNQGYTNQGANSGFSIAKADIAANPSVQANWGLLGTCVPASTLTNSQRTAYNTPAVATTSLNHLYATTMNFQPLPIELLYFNAEPKDGKVLCEWETSTETNNEYFVIERSFNGHEFTAIGQVRGFGAGTTSIVHGYSFIDADKCNDIRYYRLKQVDIDGRFSFSKIIGVNCKLDNDEISIYPNPVSTTLNYQFNSSTDANLKATIVDITGRTVSVQEISGKKGYNAVTFDVSDFPAGVYYLRVQESNDKDLQNIKQAKFFKN